MKRLYVAVALLSGLPMTVQADAIFKCGSPTPFSPGATQIEIKIVEKKNSDGTWAELSVSAKSKDSSDNFSLSYSGLQNGSGGAKVKNLSASALWLLDGEDSQGAKKHFQLSRNGASFVYWTMESGVSSIKQIGGGCRQVS
jgi:hypothetical protein